MSSVVVKLPRPYAKLRAVLDDPARDVVVEAAPCARVAEALLGWLMVRALAGTDGETFLFLAKHTAKYKARLRSWLGDAYDTAPIVFWDAEKPETAPATRVKDVVVADCEDVVDPQTWVAQNVNGMARYVGTLGSPRQWFYELARRCPAAHRITVDDAVEGGITDATRVDRVRQTLTRVGFDRHYRLLTERVEVGSDLSSITFARTRLKIRDVRGTVVPFVYRDIQKTYLAYKRMMAARLRAKGLPVKFLLLKYRRGGFTTVEQGESYKTVSTRSNVQAVTLAHTGDATRQIFRIAQLMHREDPHAPKLKGVGNAQRIEFEDLNSQFFIGAAGKAGFGRGDTFQRVHGSEVSKWGKGVNRFEFVNDLVNGLTEAASHGEVVLETTPNGNEWFAQTYKEAIANQNDWTTIFLPWFWDQTYRMPADTFSEEEIRDTLTDKERSLIEAHHLGLDQIAWRRMKIRGTGALFPQEYPEDPQSCFLSTGTIFFDASKVLDLLDEVPEYEVDPLGMGYRVIWEAPQPGVDYIAGTDTSEGIPGKSKNRWFAGTGASDPNGTSVIRADTGDQVASIHGIYTPAELAVESARLCRMYNDALWAIERNNHGHAVIAHVENGDSPAYYKHLYYATDGRVGWVTSPGTRPKMLSDYREAIDESLFKVRDRHMLQECLTFKMQSDGKWRAAAPDTDDVLLKNMIAWQVRQQPHVKSDILY